ncbi:MAG TPA: histidinol-phosphate transaminase [Gemmatimonadaceae bacterium]|nr:histidinol-phosphate transaminase [Gemmatimonadaceae bacterium]
MTEHTFAPRPGYEHVVAYRADRPAVEVDLSDNTNQWGAPPSALAALRAVDPRHVSEYPPVDSRRLAEAISAYVGVSPESTISGCGSDDLLDASMRALAQPGDRVAHPAPTFAMIPVLARANGLVPVPVPVLANGDVDADAMLATGARIMYLCTPNNPTGTAHSRRAVDHVIARAPGVVIVDEAYAEFADDIYTPTLPSHAHVFGTRTLSKSFGLAGLRVGYGVGAPALVNEVLKARGPYKVNAFAEAAATAALTHDAEWMRRVAGEVRELRPRFATALAEIGLKALPSHANFLCVPVANAPPLVERLYARGIAVRGLRGLPVIGDVLRIGLAPWPVLERVRDALRDALTDQKRSQVPA